MSVGPEVSSFTFFLWNYTDGDADHCVGNIAAIPGRGFPGLCLEDSPLGVRFADRVSVFPAGVNTAATSVEYRGSLSSMLIFIIM